MNTLKNNFESWNANQEKMVSVCKPRQTCSIKMGAKLSIYKQYETVFYCLIVAFINSSSDSSSSSSSHNDILKTNYRELRVKTMLKVDDQ